MPCRVATASARTRDPEQIATGLNPACRYATRWQSAMIKPAPMQPMRGDLSRGSCGRKSSSDWGDRLGTGRFLDVGQVYLAGYRPHAIRNWRIATKSGRLNCNRYSVTRAVGVIGTIT